MTTSAQGRRDIYDFDVGTNVSPRKIYCLGIEKIVSPREEQPFSDKRISSPREIDDFGAGIALAAFDFGQSDLAKILI